MRYLKWFLLFLLSPFIIVQQMFWSICQILTFRNPFKRAPRFRDEAAAYFWL